MVGELFFFFLKRFTPKQSFFLFLPPLLPTILNASSIPYSPASLLTTVTQEGPIQAPTYGALLDKAEVAHLLKANHLYLVYGDGLLFLSGVLKSSLIFVIPSLVRRSDSPQGRV